MIEMPLREFISGLAARQPTPAGGAAAAYSAAMGVALLQMVVSYSRGKKANEGRDDELAEAEAAMKGYSQKFLPMLERDCKSFEHVTQAYHLQRDGDSHRVRERAIEKALRGAITVPEEVLCLCRDALVLGVEILDCLSKNIASDFVSGATLLNAAAEAAGMSIVSNASFLKDREAAAAISNRVSEILDEVVASKTRIEAAVGGLLV